MTTYKLSRRPTPKTNKLILLADTQDKDEKSRLGRFADWLDKKGKNWYVPDLATYRDDLLESGLSPATVKAHLSTIRGRYDDLISNNNVREELYAFTPKQSSFVEKKAFVDEILKQIENAVNPKSAPVKVVTHQDRADSEHLRLTRIQANALLAKPGTDTLVGLRDTALISLMLCTGIREAEACLLNVDDLRQGLGGELALRIKKGKGSKQRLIPYGDLDFCLAIIDSWLDTADIQEEAVFRRFYRGGKKIGKNRLSTRAIQLMLKEYPIVINGQLREVRPHDLRRTYARRLYEAGVDIEAIRQNLGHTDRKTTQGYIGELNADVRRPPAVYDFNLASLKE